MIELDITHGDGDVPVVCHAKKLELFGMKRYEKATGSVSAEDCLKVMCE